MANPSDEPGARLETKGLPSRKYELGPVARFGRSSRSHIMVKSSRVSRHHAEVRALNGGRFCVWDCGSRNGTFVNGDRLTGSLVLSHGDEITVGDATFVFVSDAGPESCVLSTFDDTSVDVTEMGLDDRLAITLVSDIRRYTTLGERHGKVFQTFVAEWFRTVVVLLQRQHGVVDKIHGDGLLAYWWVRDEQSRTDAVRQALQTCDGLLTLRDQFARQLAEKLGEDGFDIGIGVHMGEVMLGNLGTGSVHAFTAVGDTVNVTFRLEELTKKLHHPVLVSKAVASHAPPEFWLVDQGAVMLRGSSTPLQISALQGYKERPLRSEQEEDGVATEQAAFTGSES